MGLSAVSSAGCSRHLRCAAHVPEEVPYQGADVTGAARLSVPEGYGLPPGSTGHWTFGQQCPTPRPHTPFPSLSPVGQVDCVTVRAGWLDASDGWTAARRGRVAAFVGSNLMKFAPLLGDRLAQAALSDELPSDLTPKEPQREPRLPRWRRCARRGRFAGGRDAAPGARVA